MFGVQPIICHSRFCSGVLKIQRIEEFSLGFEGNGKFRKYILQPRAHNSILPMSVDTLPLKGVCLLHLLSENIFPVLRSN